MTVFDVDKYSTFHPDSMIIINVTWDEIKGAIR